MRPHGNANVYCEGAFQTANGKTAHGLARFTLRYSVLSIVDSTCAGQDSGRLLDGSPNGIPILASIDEAVADARERQLRRKRLMIAHLQRRAVERQQE